VEELGKWKVSSHEMKRLEGLKGFDGGNQPGNIHR